MTINDGGAAFPFHHKYDGGDAREGDGMSLRDYFAAQALIALGITYGAEYFGKPDFNEEARKAYKCADAMLKARGVEPVTGVDPRD